MAKLVKTSGEIVICNPQDKEQGFTLDECYKIIGCNMIEAHQLDKRVWFVCDEEALNKPYPVYNPDASEIARLKSGLEWQLFGNILFCSTDEFK